jgi:hypothetical protein
MTTSMTASFLTLGGLLALALLPALWPGDVAAHSCDAPFSPDLVTARGIDVGQITVCNDAEFLTVTYETTFPWCVLRANLHVASDLDGIPKFRLLRTPNWLRFDDFIEDVDCEAEVTFDIPLDEIDGGVLPGDSVVVAARAVVEGEGADGTHPRCLLGDRCVAWGKGTRFRPRLPAMYFTYEVQAPPPSTSCFCDDRTATGGTTGAEILAALCPGGMLGEGVVFQELPDSTAVVNSNPQTLSYTVTTDPSDPPPVCALQDTFGARMDYDISSSEVESCREHLRVSCGSQCHRRATERWPEVEWRVGRGMN